jgi:hypothetical protein
VRRLRVIGLGDDSMRTMPRRRTVGPIEVEWVASLGAVEELDLNNLFDLPPLDPDLRCQLHDHVEELAAKNGLSWREEAIGWLDAEADFDERWFCSPILRTEFDYLSALHEIGHLVLDLDTEDAAGAILHSNEVEAWKWAVEEALITPSDAAKDQIMVAFQTHGDDAGPTSEERA